MSTFTIIALLVLAYILQVLIMISPLYYTYRRDFKEGRTIEGLTEYIGSKKISSAYIFCIFCPFFGMFMALIIYMLAIIIASIGALYNKYIKNIRI